ncbi:glucoamylase P [Plectosphaerella plurivora]|uniref:Glucoamylase n=1 Tax=Plectosphaerella plurivora TaxID=936078 RepID=A0A9P8VHB7_9PEZI|nr:glucoamylase P [Plectosphaerella plurivora]
MVSGTRLRFAGLAAALLAGKASAQEVPLDDYIATQRPVALQSVLDNIGPDGAEVPGTAAGLVVASPSRTDPPYFFTWTRDSALTFKMIVDEFIADPSANADLERHIKDYIRAQAILQTVTNPSGGLLPSGRGLGEAKYEVDGSRFNGAWGRPQRDGPPLRAVALITYSKHLLGLGGNDNLAQARDIIWPVIKNDLSYVGQYWNATGFDLWEEVSGSSFFTTQSQYRALIEGAQLAEALELPGGCGPSCAEAPQIGCFLGSSAYWNGEYFISNINTQTQRSGRDANSMLGSNVMFDVKARCDDPTIQPCHPHALSSFKSWVDDWRDGDAYPINAGIPQNEGVAVGRYLEDIYYNGNPWYLITFGAAEFLYGAVAQWNHQHRLTIDETSIGFFADLYPSAAVGTFRKGCHKNDESDTFDAILAAVTAYADSFVEVARRFTPEDGSLAEQYNRNEPFEPIGARDLTWSYAAFITMSSRRAGEYPPSWVPEGLAAAETCSPSSVVGQYAPAVAAGAPNITDGLCAVSVRFNVNASTYYGEDIYVLGSANALGAWDIGSAQPLNADGYTASRPLWSVEAEVDADGETVSYVYVRRQNCDQGFIYETINRTVDVPGCGDAKPIVLEDAWEGPVGVPGNC